MTDWYTGDDYPIDGNDYLCVDQHGNYRLGSYFVHSKQWIDENGRFKCSLWCVLPKPPVIAKVNA